MIIPGQIKENGKLLAINFGGIGDEILFLPTLKTIRQSLPSWKISLLLEPRSSSFKDLTDLCDNVIEFDIKKKPLYPSDMLNLLSILRGGDFDIVISSGSSSLVSILLFLSGIPIRIGYDSNKLARFLLSSAAPLHRDVYAGEMYHSLAAGLQQTLGVEEDSVSKNGSLYLPTIKTSDSSLEAMSRFLKDSGIADRNLSDDQKESQVVLIHPGTSKLAHAKGILKTWSEECWGELCQLLLESKFEKPVRVVLVGGPDDKEIIESIEKKVEHLDIISAYGKTKSLNDLAALIYLSDLFVCVDSAPMHISVGLNQKTVALFGPTDPSLLLPKSSQFTPIWDNEGKQRHMFDRLGVNLEVDTVFNTVKSHLT